MLFIPTQWRRILLFYSVGVWSSVYFLIEYIGGNWAVVVEMCGVVAEYLFFIGNFVG